jgi:hypothetical protein
MALISVDKLELKRISILEYLISSKNYGEKSKS